MPFYTFQQNNSGGDYNRDRNVDKFVVVEGNDIADIVDKADAIGIYFDGVDLGRDCECCGDRWSAPYDSDQLTATPKIYGSVLDADGSAFISQSTKDSNTVIHYADGSVKLATFASN